MAEADLPADGGLINPVPRGRRPELIQKTEPRALNCEDGRGGKRLFVILVKWYLKLGNPRLGR